MKKLFFIISSIFLIGYFNVIFYNHGLILYWGDQLEQYLPHLTQFVKWIQSGEFSFWNPSIGFGSNAFVGFFISLGSPFTWIAALFPIEHLPYLFVFFDFIRFMFTAIFAYKWLSYIAKNEYARITGAFIVTFSGYMMAWIHYGPFIDSFMGFVLVLYASEKLLNKGSYWLFVVSVIFLFLLNPYYFYMFSWFLLIYMSYRVLSLKQDFKYFTTVAFKFVLYFIGSIGLIAFIVLPIVYLLTTTPRVGGISFIDLIPIIDLRTVYAMFTSFFSVVFNDYDYNVFYSYFSDSTILTQPYIFSGVIFLMILYPFSRIKAEDKVFVLSFYLTFILMMFIPAFYKLFNGNTDSRWMFMIVLANAILVTYTLDRFDQIKKKDLYFNFLIVLSLIITIGYITYTNKWFTDVYIGRFKIHLIYLIGMTSLYTLHFLIIKYSFSKFLFMGLLILEGAYILNRRMTFDGSPYYMLEETFNYDAIYSNENINFIKSIDQGFYRIDIEHGITTLPASLDYPGFLMYMSIYNHNSQDYLDNRFSPFRKIEYAPSKTIAKTITGSKYWISQSGFVPFGFQKINENVAMNTVDVGLGFATNKSINLDDFKTTSTFIKDISMYFGIINTARESSVEVSLPRLVGDSLINQSINLEKSDISGYYIIDYSYTNEYTSCKVDYYQNGEISNSIETNEYGYSSVPMLANTEKMYFYCNNQYNVNDFTAVDVYEITENYINSINANLSNFDFIKTELVTKDYIKSNIDVSDKNSFIYSTIPFDLGWNVYIDGKKVETFIVNEGFLGFNIDDGLHTIEFKYIPPGFNLGLVISGISIIGFIMLLIRDRKQYGININ